MARPSSTVRLLLAAVFSMLLALAGTAGSAAEHQGGAAGARAEAAAHCPPRPIPYRCDDTSWGG